MSDLAAIITASASVLTVTGGAIAFVWNKVEKGFGEIRGELDKCRQRDATRLLVIELLWQAASKSKAAAPVLARCKEHLDKLKEQERQP